MSYLIELPWPPRSVHPNGGAHPHTKSAAKKALRAASGAAAAFASGQLPPGRLAAILRFCPPDRRKRDLDGMVASMKSALDGVFEWEGRDDSDIKFVAGCWGECRSGGAVLVCIRPYADVKAMVAWLDG